MYIFIHLFLTTPHPICTSYFYSIEVKEIAGRKVIILNQVHDEDTSVATIVVRASTENLINDVERALDDGIQSVKTLCTDGRLLPGAGEFYFLQLLIA